MVKKKIIVKKIEWKIHQPYWLGFSYMSMVFIFFAYLDSYTSFANVKTSFYLEIFGFIAMYLVCGRYPYGWKTYYKQV